MIECRMNVFASHACNLSFCIEWKSRGQFCRTRIRWKRTQKHMEDRIKHPCALPVPVFALREYVYCISSRFELFVEAEPANDATLIMLQHSNKPDSISLSLSFSLILKGKLKTKGNFRLKKNTMLCTTTHIVCVHNTCVCSFTWIKYKGNMHHTHKDVSECLVARSSCSWHAGVYW